MRLNKYFKLTSRYRLYGYMRWTGSDALLYSRPIRTKHYIELILLKNNSRRWGNVNEPPAELTERMKQNARRRRYGSFSCWCQTMLMYAAVIV